MALPSQQRGAAYLLNLLSLWVAMAVPMVWNSYTSTISITTATSMMPAW